MRAKTREEIRKAKEAIAETKVMHKRVGDRLDGGKPRYDLIPPAVLKALAIHMEKCQAKYPHPDDRNWELGMDWNTCYRALQSHSVEWALGRDTEIDPKMPEGYEAPHLIAIIWNAMVLFEYQRRGIGRDNRPVAQFVERTPQELQTWHRRFHMGAGED